MTSSTSVGAVVPSHGPYLPSDVAEHLEELPALLIGTPKEMAEHLEQRRERFGFSYVTVLEDGMERLAPVIELLR